MRAAAVLALLLAFARAAAQTAASDIIGTYALHPDSWTVAPARRCPRNVSVDTFAFDQFAAPSVLSAPRAFNILVPHNVQRAEGRVCESSGRTFAVQSAHPFVKDVRDVVAVWSTGGGRFFVPWVGELLVTALEKSPWVFGYDFVERSCGGIVVRPGTAYMWFTPKWDVPLGETVSLQKGEKYLLLTFAGRDDGCVYVADAVGGDGDLPLGPVSDPSLADGAPVVPTGPAPPAAPAPAETPGTETLMETPGADGDDIVPEPTEAPPPPPSVFSEPTPTPLNEPPSVATDPGGIFGPAVEPTGDAEADTGSACFPAAAAVTLDTGAVVAMADLRLGARVRVSQEQHSDIFFFSHRAVVPGVMHPFLRIATVAGPTVTLSPEHYLYVNGVLAAARTARPGDLLSLADGAESPVLSVVPVRAEGLFAPHSLHGDIVVDGVRASTYTTAVHPRLAHHVLLAPLRALYRAGMLNGLGGVLDGGADGLARIMPSGPDTLSASSEMK